MGKPLVENSPTVEFCFIRTITREKRSNSNGYFVYLGIVYELQDASRATLKVASYETTLLPERELPYTDADVLGANDNVEAIIAQLKKDLAGYPSDAPVEHVAPGVMPHGNEATE